MHTPGPWTIRPYDLMQRIQNTDGHTVAIPAMNDGVSALECSANARLIAKAPDFRDALQNLLTAIHHRENNPGFYSAGNYVLALERARKLLED